MSEFIEGSRLAEGVALQNNCLRCRPQQIPGLPLAAGSNSTMSAFGSKADVVPDMPRCPLLTQVERTLQYVKDAR
jgi:hypothetical protein